LKGEALLENYADLGGANGYVVPIFDAAGAQRMENCHLLEQAGLIYISDGPDALGLVRALRGSPALQALARAFDDGAAVLGMGAGAIALGAWIADPDNLERAEPGWGWLPDVVVEPHFTETEAADRLQSLLNAQSACLGLGIPEQSALALGPAGEVESVGPGQVTVVLGGVALSAPTRR
jgi:cyanophycinase